MALDPGYDPTAQLEGYLRGDYARMMKDVVPFQQQLLDQAMNDTSIVDRAREIAPMEIEKQRQIAERNLSRYGGGNLSPAQRKEMQRAQQRGGKLATTNAINLARRNQADVNQTLRQQLLATFNREKASATGMLAQSGLAQVSRENAYRNAKAQYRQNLFGLGGSLIKGIITGAGGGGT